MKQDNIPYATAVPEPVPVYDTLPGQADADRNQRLLLYTIAGILLFIAGMLAVIVCWYVVLPELHQIRYERNQSKKNPLNEW